MANMSARQFVNTFGHGSFSSVNLAKMAVNTMNNDEDEAIACKSLAVNLLHANLAFTMFLRDLGMPDDKVDKETLTVLHDYKDQLHNFDDDF